MEGRSESRGALTHQSDVFFKKSRFPRPSTHFQNVLRIKAGAGFIQCRLTDSYDGDVLQLRVFAGVI